MRCTKPRRRIGSWVVRMSQAIMNYEQWNRFILSYIFEDRDPGEFVFLQTNSETLSEIAELSDFNVPDAVESLTTAVREKVVKTGHRVDLWDIDPKNFWINSPDKEPLQATFLALTVLAASNMVNSDGVYHTNYYVRLNELLFDEPIQGCPKGMKYVVFERLWTHLRKWAEEEHNVELYLTEGSSNRRYVWYPISQCLISEHDRRKIYHFFFTNKLTPFSDLSDDELLYQLCYWTSSSQGSAKLNRHLSNESYKSLILSQVKSLLKLWDGEIPPEESTVGGKLATAPVSVELRLFDTVEVRYWFPRRGRRETICETNKLVIKYLQTSALEKWFRPVIDNTSTFWKLPNSLQIKTVEAKPIIYTLGYSAIWVFREDSERDDGWLSQRNMQLYEDHLIVFRQEFTEQVIACLKQTCNLGEEIPNSIYDGWFYLRANPAKLASFSTQNLWRLSVGSGKHISFIGGLSVQDHHRQKAYLNICLPFVFVPDLGFSDRLPLQVNSQEFSVGNERLVVLADTLGTGVHKISYGTQTRELRVITPRGSQNHKHLKLVAALSRDSTMMPTYTLKKIAEVSTESGVWLTGARFLGADIPEVTWEDVQIEPPAQEEGSDVFSKTPAELISLVVKTAIELKQGKASVPAWLGKAIEYLDRNVALRVLVQKKLGNYHETALSYANLRKEGGDNRGSKTVSRR